MADPKPKTPPLAEMTVKDLFAKIGNLSQPALWAIVAMLIANQSGCELPSVSFGGKLKDRLHPPAVADVPNAIGRITMGNVGCTATIIGPIADTDKEIHILTAAHCLKVGTAGTMYLKDGRKIAFKCVSRDEQADCAWLTAARPEGKIPFAFLATKLPEKGAAVWHQGYGIDKPGNLEKGTFAGVSGDGRQCQFVLSVSSGDSGGGIVHTGDGHILSPVCCTSRLSGPGNVWGSTPANAAAIKPGRLAASDEGEKLRPIIILPAEGWPDEPPLG